MANIQDKVNNRAHCFIRSLRGSSYLQVHYWIHGVFEQDGVSYAAVHDSHGRTRFFALSRVVFKWI